MTTNPPPKGPNILGAFMDFLILILLVGGAGFGGYYWGTIQRMAPVNTVPAGTPGAIPDTSVATSTLAISKTAQSKNGESKKADPQKTEPATPVESAPIAETTPASSEKTSSSTSTKTNTKSGKIKYWLVSTGTDYIGYVITVSVNKTPVDSFYGPGKTVDVTKLVKPGENTVSFDAKEMEKYNKHKGDAKSELKIQLVTGPFVQENFEPDDVLAEHTRNAAETENFQDEEHFVKE